jgi:carbon storage regulator
MLVLSRKETQRIRVGDSIVVTVVRVSGDKVRLGIEAPADMLVLRDELEPRGEGVEADGVSPAQLTVELNLSEVEEAILRQQVA